MALIPGKQLGADLSDLNFPVGGLSSSRMDLTTGWDFTTVAPTTAITPAADTEIANKAYVDAVASGLDVKDSVRVATAAALPANTPSGSGVGKLITANAVGVLTVDGVATVLNDRILVKDEVAGQHNGIYYVSTEGTAGVAFVLTRATDADQAAELNSGMFCFVEEGTANGDAGFALTTNDPITIDTTSLTFTQFSGAGQITAGTGATKSGNTINVIGGNGITANADDIEVDYAIPTVNALSDASSFSEGVANTAMRTDARIIITTAAPANVAAANAQGSSTSLARADHAHASPTSKNANKAAASAATSGDGQTTGLTIANSPALGSYVRILVNGLGYELGDGVKTKDCYFSVDSGTTARAISAIASGDTLFWNGVVAGFDLATSDIIDMDYLAF